MNKYPGLLPLRWGSPVPGVALDTGEGFLRDPCNARGIFSLPQATKPTALICNSLYSQGRKRSCNNPSKYSLIANPQGYNLFAKRL